MVGGMRLFVRTVLVLLYGAFLVGIYGGLHFYLAAPASLQENRVYGDGEGPEYFPVLVVEGRGTGTETLVLRSLAKEQYSVLPAGRSWYLYRVPGEGRLDVADRVHFRVESLDQERQRVEVSVQDANGQRTSIYTYELAGNQVAPRSHQLLAAFGNNFSPLPFSLLLTGLIIFLSEKFLVRRLLRPPA